jgi:ribosome-binding factor A
MANYRGGRINEEFKREISTLIRTEIKDPRLTAMISVTDVQVTKDLRYAKVFVSIFSKDEEEKKSNLEALRSASGFMRKAVGQKINLRHTPEITIELDDSINYGMHMDELIQRISKE